MMMLGLTSRRATSSLDSLQTLVGVLPVLSSSCSSSSAAAASSSPGPSSSRTHAPAWSRSIVSAPSSQSRKSPQQHFTKAQKRAGQLRKRINLEKRALLQQIRDETQPDPVLGYRPGNAREPGTNDESLWENCELKKIILKKEEVWGVTEDRRGNLVSVETEASAGSAEERRAVEEQGGGPLRLNFGLEESDRQLLFKDLPDVMVKDRILDSLANNGANASAFYRAAQEDPAARQIEDEYEALQRQEGRSADFLARILDLRNASAKGIDVENKRRIVAHFGGETKSSGTVETQVALLTYRLHLLHEHLSKPAFRKDNVTRRSMTLLVHKRAKLLKYLKRQSEQRYVDLLTRVGLHRRAVEGEIIVPGRPKLLSL